jgi:hypothetical protein
VPPPASWQAAAGVISRRSQHSSTVTVAPFCRCALDQGTAASGL